jgi:hypothetical protein
MTFEPEIADSLAYLASDAAQRSLEADSYWPKWHSPWWHMLLLHEMGETHRIPEPAIRQFAAKLGAMRLKIFPIHAHDMTADADPHRDSACHCQLGNAYRVLNAWGIDVESEVPWIKPWFYKYQMEDGGLNCDDAAYRVAEECPSSMVGTISAFEAVLDQRRPWSTGDEAFLSRGAAFLMERRLTQGSTTAHNAEERTAAQNWPTLCFPRFYHYDTLRGLAALARWAERTGNTLPPETFTDTARDLHTRFPDGRLCIGRRVFEGARTLTQLPNGKWDATRHPATTFPLLDAVSAIGSVSPYLSAQWAKTKSVLPSLGHRRAE